MQKLLLVTLIFSSCLSMVEAQLDVKLNPIALLSEVGQFSVEYSSNENWGLEGEAIVARDAIFLFAQGKHYFNPKRGADKFNIGALMGVLSTDNNVNFGLGFFTGYKWISPKNILFELAVGIGRAYAAADDFFPYGKLYIGYRFKEKDAEK